MRTRTSLRMVRAHVLGSGLYMHADNAKGYVITRRDGNWLFNGSLKECDSLMDGWRAHRVFGPELDAEIERKVNSLTKQLKNAPPYTKIQV